LSAFAYKRGRCLAVTDSHSTSHHLLRLHFIPSITCWLSHHIIVNIFDSNAIGEPNAAQATCSGKGCCCTHHHARSTSCLSRDASSSKPRQYGFASNAYSGGWINSKFCYLSWTKKRPHTQVWEGRPLFELISSHKC
jgi:hypothetical protein